MVTPCPRCSAGLTGAPTCAACGLPLTGPTALALWQVDQRIADLDARMSQLRAERQQLSLEHTRLVADLGGSSPVALPAFPGARPAPPAPLFPPQWTPPSARPKQEWTPRRVQNVLLTIGAMLLVIAGAIFTAVSWQHLGAAVRGTILLSLTGAAALGARALASRGLTATAEAISSVGVGLGVFDAYAFHALVLPDVTGYAYWAVATALLAVAAAGLGRLTGVRVPWLAAAVLLLLPLLILCTQPTGQAERAVLVSLDALVAVTALAVLLRTTVSSAVSSQVTADLRRCWAVGGTLLWALGFAMSATHSLYGLQGQAVLPILVAIGFTAIAAALAAWVEGATPLPGGMPLLPVFTGATALSVVCGLALPVEAQVDVTWWALALIAASLVVLLGAVALPAPWRLGPVATAAVAAALAGSTELPSVFTTVVGQIQWIQQPWSVGTALAGRDSTLALAQQWAGPANLLCLVACAVAAVVTGVLLGRRAAGLAAAAALVVIAALVAVPQLGGSYLLGLSVDLAVVAVAAAAAVLAGGRVLVGQLATLTALAGAVLVGCWSLAVPAASAVVAVALVAVLVGAAVAGAPYRPLWGGAAVLSGGYAAVALSHLAGVPDPATGLAAAGVPLAITAGLLVASRRSAPTLTHDVLEGAAVVVAVAGLMLACADAGWGSWTLLAVATAALVSTARPVRRPALPASTALGLLALTLLPFAQQLPAGPAVASCVTLTALSVAGATLLARTPAWHPVAEVLAVGSVFQAACAVGSADRYLTATLCLLCLIFATVAVLPNRLVTDAGVHLGVRAAGTGLAAAAFLGAVAAGCTDGRLQPPTVALVVALSAAALAAGATLLKDRQPDSVVVEVVAAVAAAASLVGSVDRPVYAGWVLAIAGLAVLVSATRADRRSWWPVGAVLLSSATWLWLRVAGVDAPEPYTDPIAVVALVVGWSRRRSQPNTPSLTAYGPGLSGLLLPSLAWALTGQGDTRPMLLAALATGVVVVGAQYRLRAPLLLGAVTVVLCALRLLAPYEAMVPRWLEVGTAGALLLTLGATYEQRRRDLGVLRSRYDALL